ncbi:MAG: transcriptional regulator, partial [Acidaminococcaceae bacterium]|nr:transcriptional regulator [Acidaminococcaceae bacterium]
DPAKKDKDGKTLEIKEQVESIADAERLAKKRLREKNKEEWTGNISVVGNLLIVAANTVALQGFGVFDGNYIIVRASHSISNGYTTSFDVRRCLDGY